MTSSEAAPTLRSYSNFPKPTMPRNHFFLYLGISVVALLAACGKSEVPSTESANASGMRGVEQSPVLAPVAVLESATDSKQSDNIKGKSKALSMANGLALAHKNNCLACHMIEKKLVGPAWRDVAKRYKGVAGIEHKLVIKVSIGGEGNWGNMPMPAMAPAVKEEDIRALVKFVLSLEN